MFSCVNGIQKLVQSFKFTKVNDALYCKYHFFKNEVTTNILETDEQKKILTVHKGEL